MFARVEIAGWLRLRGRRIARLAVVAGVEDASAELPHRLAGRHGRAERHVEAAAAAAHRNEQPRVGAVVHMVGHARRFAAKQ